MKFAKVGMTEMTVLWLAVAPLGEGAPKVKLALLRDSALQQPHRQIQ